MAERIALLIESDWGFRRAMLAGISAAARGRRWEISILPPVAGAVAELRAQPVAGVIVRANAEALPGLRRLGMPLVVIGARAVRGPRVWVDDAAIGAAAAAHLRGLERTSYAAVGYPGRGFAATRLAAFAAALAAPCARWTAGAADSRALRAWLAALPRPCALFAANDLLAREIARLAREIGRSIPGDLAVLGVDDDELLCDLGEPSLSSVVLPYRGLGAAAAGLLARLIAGEPAPADPLLLPPLGVHRRASTTASVDPAVARALAWIADHLGDDLAIADLARAASLPRRSLERRLRAATGRSPLAELQRARLERARALLAKGTLPITAVAHACGFRSDDHFAAFFRGAEGVAPGRWRARHMREVGDLPSSLPISDRLLGFRP